MDGKWELSERASWLIDRIVDIEDEMVDAAIAMGAKCDDNQEVRRLVRRATLSVLSEETLQSYMEDLERAREEGKNLMELRFGRESGLIGGLSLNWLIGDIVKIERDWHKEWERKYPALIDRHAGYSFEGRLSYELETYSDRTIKFYYRDLSKAKNEGRNLVEERYTLLAHMMGYRSLEDWLQLAGYTSTTS